MKMCGLRHYPLWLPRWENMFKSMTWWNFENKFSFPSHLFISIIKETSHPGQNFLYFSQNFPSYNPGEPPVNFKSETGGNTNTNWS